MQCTNCGAALKPTAKICISCGTPVSSGSRSSIGEETSNATNVSTPNPDGRADVGSGSVPTSPVLKNSSSVESVSETGGNSQPALGREREVAVESSSPQYEAASGDLYIKDRPPSPEVHSQETADAAKPKGKFGGKFVLAAIGFVFVVGIGGTAFTLGKREPVVPTKIVSAPVVGTQGSEVATPASPATMPPPVVVEAKLPSGALGASAIDSGTVTKDVLNEMLQLAIENDWANIDLKVRGLKGASFEGGDRKVARALNRAALDLMARNEFSLAAGELEKAVVADRNDIEIRNNLGYAELRAGKYDAAVTHLLDTLLIDPSRAGGWLNAAEAFAEKDKSSAAEASLKLAFHFSRDQAKALAYIKGDSSQIPSQKFRAAIQKVEPGLGTVPQFAR
jgi:hypothetical protein